MDGVAIIRDISQIGGEMLPNNSRLNALAGANNANNRLIANGTSGNYNNNERINGNALRVFLEFDFKEANDPNRLVSYEEWFAIHKRCRKHKAGKSSVLEYEIRIFITLKETADNVENFEYIPKASTTFVIEIPKIREIIAAYYGDREVQTYFVSKIERLLDKFLNPHSYSCRVGMGTLRAVIHLQEVIYEATNEYTEDAWVFTKDLSSFFMNIDTEIWVRRLIDFIDKNYEGKDKELLKYLARIIYQQQPQKDALMHSPITMWNRIPEEKKLKGRVGYIGIPIGDLTSQIMALFVTTWYIHNIEVLTEGIAHYTDDTGGVVKDKELFLSQQRLINEHAQSEYGLTVNRKKFYFQHYTKGVQFLGYKIKRDRLLPSDRIYHNITWKVHVAIEKATEMSYVLHNKESFQSTVNSYLGLLKWSNSYRLRKRIVEALKESLWAVVFDFSKDYLVVKIKRQYSLGMMYKREGKQLKNSIRYDYRRIEKSAC